MAFFSFFSFFKVKIIFFQLLIQYSVHLLSMSLSKVDPLVVHVANNKQKKCYFF